jgi:hypothetical protein
MIEMVSISTHRGQFRGALVRALLAGLDPARASPASTLAFVDDRLARIGGVTRLAVLGVEGLLSAAFAVALRAPCADSPRSRALRAPCAESPRSRALLRRLDVTALPLLADYVRLVRSLALVYAYETHPPTARAPRSR